MTNGTLSTLNAGSRTPANVWNWRDGTGRWTHDELAVEEPLEIRVQGRPISVTMRTPGHDHELAIGFLVTEQVIGKPGDVRRVARCCSRQAGRNIVNVQVAATVPVDLNQLTRHVFASSSCGLCGKVTIDAITRQFPPVTSRLHCSAELLASLPDQMQSAQATFHHTGGLHAAALFDEGGRMLVLREDIGRHNAVDKVVGWAFMNGSLPLDRHILLVSGRSSFEIMQKALAAAIPIVAAVSAPSSLAVEFASQSGQTLVGFVRERRINVYTHPCRVTADDFDVAAVPAS